MRALTLTQPWATLVVLGVKEYETRGWRPGVRFPQRIAIHAAKGWTREDREFADLLFDKRILRVSPLSLPRGAVVGEATVLYVYSTSRMPDIDAPEALLGDFSEGRYAWHLDEPEAYAQPIPARGALGLWDWQGAS